jgi:hypothetical protein
MRRTLQGLTLAAFAMDDATSEQHADLWSVSTRMLGPTVIALAVWSRAWMGWWSLAPNAGVAVWRYFNPRMFPPPASTGNWASRAVLGQRIWLRRDRNPIPRHDEIAARLLTTVASLGLLPFLCGLAMLEVWPTLLGMAIAFLAKLWVIDRMAWLYWQSTAGDGTSGKAQRQRTRSSPSPTLSSDNRDPALLVLDNAQHDSKRDDRKPTRIKPGGQHSRTSTEQ